MPGSVNARILVLAGLLLLLGLGGILAYWYMQPAPVAPPPVPVAEEPRQLREVLLYFATPDGVGLEAEMREIEGLPTEESWLRATIQALAAGPRGALVPVLPANVPLQQVAVAGATATLSFGPEMVSGHPGGSMSELLTVHALANTLAVNFPHIRQVRILVDGAPVETLKGHVDLREPIAADFDFGRAQTKAGEVRPGGE